MDLEIQDASEQSAPDSPLGQLWKAIADQKGVGTPICARLISAKCPRLIPILDSVVSGLFDAHYDFREGTRYALPMQEDRALIAASTDSAGRGLAAAPDRRGALDAE